jgi:cytochrome c oxidase assembly protein subunit 15
MVSSGVNQTNIFVNHIKLSVHFVSAMVLACYTLWFALQLLIPAAQRVVAASLSNFTVAIIAILGVQLTYGAFMAGLKAATVAPSWPTINGMWVPGSLATESLVNNPVNVHFIHRGLAYLLIVVLVAWFIKAAAAAKKSALLARVRTWPVLLVVAQVVLGIVTVLSAPRIVWGKFGIFEVLAELHQLVAMFLLMALIVNLYVVKRR